MKPIISGIQQVGVGIPDVYPAFKWYRQKFGMDIAVFDEAAEAALMLPYTGGEPRSRHAVLALNIQGGGGLEIWQYTSRVPQPAAFEIMAGDTGIYIAKFKSPDVRATYAAFQKMNLDLVTEVMPTPDGRDHFYLKDPYGNLCEVVPADAWFKKNGQITGGIYGCTIGVSDIEKARAVYSDILGYDEVVYDETNTFDDFANFNGGGHEFRRVLLRHSKPRRGAFSRLLGPSEMELIQVIDRKPKKIFENRLWGDLGFIHLCFDIRGMGALKALCDERGFPFTVDSGDFDMGEAAGHFSYIEDPDGTLIEFVEAHKVPILKKLNLYLSLKKRNPVKPLPNWMVAGLAFNRVKD